MLSHRCEIGTDFVLYLVCGNDLGTREQQQTIAAERAWNFDVAQSRVVRGVSGQRCRAGQCIDQSAASVGGNVHVENCRRILAGKRTARSIAAAEK